jgi:hypothetical protein
MIDRMVCADGRTRRKAKALELEGWPYPRQSTGRHFGIVVHGDSVGAETLRRSLVDWPMDMKLISAGGMAETDGYIGYMKLYARSHEDLAKRGCQRRPCACCRNRTLFEWPSGGSGPRANGAQSQITSRRSGAAGRAIYLSIGVACIACRQLDIDRGQLNRLAGTSQWCMPAKLLKLLHRRAA